MKMRVVVIGLLIVVCAAALWVAALHCNWFGSEWSQAKADTETRQAVSRVKSIQIAAIELRDPPYFLIVTPDGTALKQSGLDEQSKSLAKVVNNPEAISLMLTGLKEAVKEEVQPVNQLNSVDLVLKDGSVIGPFYYGMRPVDCFSPTFIKGLRALGIKAHHR
ncbi:MAG: hypothetical protein M1133_05635 [Armatimonadetes bacterium]|nr:hypothetical protein [Armatimonadota bacterium]